MCGDERTRDLAEVLLSAHVPLVQTAWYHRWIRGDEEAWEQLVEVMGPVVYQFCFHFTQHRTTAEELTQEIFIKLLQNLPRLGHHTNLKCWLLRTAYHHCVDWHRRQKHERKFLQRWWREATTRFYTSVQEQLALQRDVQRVLRMLIKALPPELRVVLIMREFLEMSYDDMARTLGIPVGTVKSRLNRARNLLAHRLRSAYPDLQGVWEFGTVIEMAATFVKE